MFNFADFVKTKISGADYSGVRIKIETIPNSIYASLYKGTGSTNIINVGDDSLLLSDSIIFQPVNNKFGTFKLEYKVIVLNEELPDKYTITFNVCHKDCLECSTYNSENPTDKQCTKCIPGQTYEVQGISNNCFNQTEIERDHPNYYLNTPTQIYMPCESFCQNCSNTADNCITCINLYYFVQALPNINESPKKCYSLDFINDEGKYFLSEPPNGDKFYLCQSNCKTCRLNEDNCFSCEDNYYFDIDDLYKCKQGSSMPSNHYLVKDTYIMKDSTCAVVEAHNNKKKCSTCATTADNRPYYQFKDENNFCYLIEELNYERGINIYLDESDPNQSNHKFDKCNQKCLICHGQATNCTKCSENYYFITTSPSECQSVSYINNLPDKYYLPKGSDTYYQCDPNCVCELKKDYCTSCTNNYILKPDENKCYPPTTQIQGYYNDNGIFKKCHDSCLKCGGEGPDKCTDCAHPYYPFKLDTIYKRCITEIDKKKNSEYDGYYLKKDNTGNKIGYEKCDTSCLTCEDGEDGKQCIKCHPDYAFYENGGQECLKKSDFFNTIAHEHYYFNSILQEFRECHKSCKSCKDGDRYNNCYECNINYVFIDDQSNGKCVLESLFQIELTNYYKHSNNRIELRGGSSKNVDVFKKCPENCDKCNAFEDNPLKCLECNRDKGYYKHTLQIVGNIQEECYDNSIIEHYYYNDNKYTPSMSECLISTYETQEKGKCIQCHNKYGYYSLEHAPETCQNTIPEDHYVSLNNIIMKCPYECASCSEGPTSTSTNCNVCKEEFPPSISNPKNCIFKCDYYQYKYYDNKYCTGEKECPDLVPYLIKENSTCVETCERVSYYGICLDTCPAKTTNNGRICQDIQGVCNLYQADEIREHLVDLQKDISPVTKRVKKYYKYFENTNYHVDIYNHYLNEYTMIIYQNNDCVKELLPDYISLDFPQSYCSGYSQSQIIIVLFIVQRENKYSLFYYQLYKIDNYNKQVNLINNNICSKVKVEVPHNQANFDIEKYEEYIKLNPKIDLTDRNENFFHDMCFQNYEDGKDIVIKQRREEYYQDRYKICLDNCDWNDPDFTYKRAVCLCSSVTHSLDDVNIEYYDYNINYITGDDFYNNDINVFEHLKCFKYNFEDGKIFKNMGSYMIIIFLLIEIIAMIVYSVLGIDSIKMFIIDFIKGNPPKKIKIKIGNEEELNKKENNNDKDNKSITSNKNSSSDSRVENKSNKNNKNRALNNNFMDGENKEIEIKKKTKSWERPDLLIGRSNNLGNFNNVIKGIEVYHKYNKIEEINENDEENYLSNKIKSLKQSKLYSSKINLKNSIKNIKDNNFEKYEHTFTDYELNSMELYDAEIKDKRTFCQFYKLQMLEKQEFYRTFVISEPLYPFSIKIIIYIFNLTLNLVFNALFYTEEQIYKGVKSLGKNIGYIFLRAFYSFLVVKGIDYLINLLIKNANYLRSLVYRRKREKELRVDSYKSLKHIKANFCLFFVLVMICDVLFWIYISSFCYCYHGEQTELFWAFIVTQFYIEIYCVIFGLYLAVFRFIGLKCKATTCYKLSQTFLDT